MRKTASIAALLLPLGLVWLGHADAAAPSGRYTLTVGTALDTRTGLEWVRDNSSGNADFAAATQYCATLNLEGTGWRVPTVKELLSIVDDGATTSPVVDSTVFPMTKSGRYWSTTPVDCNGTCDAATQRWTVHFGSGDNGNSPLDELAPVRCVR